MSRIGGRLFAGFGAILFLTTSSALTVAVIYTLMQQNKQPSTNAAPTTSSDTVPAPAGYEQLSSTTNLTGAKLENFTPSPTPVSKLQTTDIQVGTGSVVPAGAGVTAAYVGALASTGVIFDASSNHGGPQIFTLSGVLPGWSQGIPGMKVGGTRRLIIPAALAYGAQSQTGIPAYSDLVFDVTVIKIN